MSKLRRFLATNVIGLVALFFALGGTAFAARGLITGSDIAADTITGANVNESTLGKVPSSTNADLLGGASASSFLRGYVTVNGATVTLAPGQSGYAEALCPSGKQVLGGGYDTVVSQTPLGVLEQSPDHLLGHVGWLVSAENPDPSTGAQFQAFAICAAAS